MRVACKLSVNLNKVALLRNSRGGRRPSLLEAAEVALNAGAAGITLHWRADERHTRKSDVAPMVALCRQRGVEFNLEGDLRRPLLDLALEVGVDQCTLVPVRPGELTSDHGWDLPDASTALLPAIAELEAAGIRTSIFVEAKPGLMGFAADTGTRRIELYTEPYAAAFQRGDFAAPLAALAETAARASDLGLGVNAGHDLDVHNLPPLVAALPALAEVSIGHALICDALAVGLEATVRAYVAALAPPEHRQGEPQ